MKKIGLAILAFIALSVITPNNVFAEIEKKVKISTNDSTAGYLNGKLVCGSNLTCVENNDGSNESLQLNAVASGSGMVLDLDDDNANESTAMAEIATTGDTYNVFTEPSADKLSINLSNKWPLSHASVSLQSNGSNCSSGLSPLGVDASGASEGCFDVATQTEFDTHASRHAFGGLDEVAFYAKVQEEGVDVTPRRILNFVGGGITCADDTLKTTCTLSGGGVSDHGLLTGLADDDHTQYGLLAGRSGGQTLIGGTGAGDDLVFSTTSNVTKGTYRFTDLISCDTIDSDASGNLTCGTDNSGGGGSPLYLDLGNDSSNESLDVSKLSTSGDTNNIVTEPTANNVLFDFAQDYPKADAADALAANGANCSAGSWAGGVSATGVAEDCTPDDDQPDSDSEVPNALTVNMQDSSTIVNGANPTVDAEGEIATDSTHGQLLYYTNGQLRVIDEEHTACVMLTDVTSADDNLLIYMPKDNIVVSEVGCRYEGTGTTVATIAFEDSSGNAMTHTAPTCSTGGTNATFQAVTSGGGIVSGEGIRIDVTNTPSPLTDDYEICFVFKSERQ
jgi:hypothetical protein